MDPCELIQLCCSSSLTSCSWSCFWEDGTGADLILPATEDRLTLAYPACGSGQPAGLGEGLNSSACPAATPGARLALFMLQTGAWGKTSWAKSTAVGSGLSLLPCVFSSLKHPLLGLTRMSCSYHLSRAAQLQNKWRIGLFNFGSLGYCFPLSNWWGRRGSPAYPMIKTSSLSTSR